jgi:hypothetical protein
VEAEGLQDELYAGTKPERVCKVSTVAVHEIVGQVAGAKVKVDGRRARQELLAWQPSLCPSVIEK